MVATLCWRHFLVLILAHVPGVNLGDLEFIGISDKMGGGVYAWALLALTAGYFWMHFTIDCIAEEANIARGDARVTSNQDAQFLNRERTLSRFKIQRRRAGILAMRTLLLDIAPPMRLGGWGLWEAWIKTPWKAIWSGMV